MLDFSHLPNAQNGSDTQIFRNAGQRTMWNKPRGKTMVYVLAIGSGAGGGGGASGAASSARGGGGGGGASGFSSVIVPARFIPDVLQVYVGKGGSGGAAGLAGSGGDFTYVIMNTDFVTSYNESINLASGNPPTGGGAGTSSAAGAAGGAGTGTGAIAFGVANFGLLTTTGGGSAAPGGAQTGAIGPSSSNQASQTYGGCGGGGVTTTDFAGGSFIPNGTLFPSILGGVTPGGAGSNGCELSPAGIFMLIPMIFAPGSGGGSNNSGTGGAGGNGATGCGGGGGGGGVTGGAGGNGGDGLVVITCW